MKSSKRRETYVDLAFCVEGQPARVFVRGAWYRTTLVQEIVPHFDGPVFETRNTIYWPAPTDGSCIAVDYKYKEKHSEDQLAV